MDNREYWQSFGRLITLADTGTVLTCIGWIFFWLDHIPGHTLHTYFLVNMAFVAGSACGLAGFYLLLKGPRRLGTRTDRLTLVLQLAYAVAGSVSGFISGQLFPPA